MYGDGTAEFTADYIDGLIDYADYVDAVTTIRFGLERQGIL